MRTDRRQFLQAGAAFGALAALPMALHAQTLELVKIINGFPAGGTADATARRIGERMVGTPFAKNVVVDNKPGAGGRIACDVVKAASPVGVEQEASVPPIMSATAGAEPR